MGEHRLSDGMVDGKKHKAPGRRVRDRTRRPLSLDFDRASKVIRSMNQLFDLKTDTYEDFIRKPCQHVSIEVREQSRARFSAFRQLFSTHSARQHSLNDFMSTLRSPVGARQRFNLRSSTSKQDVYVAGTFGDAPYTTHASDLHFSSKSSSDSLFISCLPSSMLVRDVEGTALWEMAGCSLLLVALKAYHLQDVCSCCVPIGRSKNTWITWSGVLVLPACALT